MSTKTFGKSWTWDLVTKCPINYSTFFSVYKLSLFIMEPLGKFVDCSTLSIVRKNKFLRLLGISKKRKLIKRMWRVNWKEGKQSIIKDGTLAVGKKEGSRLKGKTRDCPRKMRLPTKFISEKGNFWKDFDAPSLTVDCWRSRSKTSGILIDCFSTAKSSQLAGPFKSASSIAHVEVLSM